METQVFDAFDYIEKIKQQRKKRKVIVMYSVFGDESHDEKAQRVYAVAGVGGSEKEWASLEYAWIERTKGIVFHPTDCESDKGDYKDFTHEENQRLYRDLVKILTNTGLLGCAAVIDLKGLRAVFPDMDEDVWPYSGCFSKVVGHFRDVGRLLIPQEKVKFSFHINQKTQWDASSLYNYLMTLPEDERPPDLCLADEISFISREDMTGIQVACLFAREAMKHYDNLFIEPRRRRERASMRALFSTGRFELHYYNKKYYENMLNDWQRLPWAKYVSDGGYEKWLQKNKLKHTQGNGIRYLDYVRKSEEIKS
jgi:hypothetical protein